jgi:P4 family phage/plasmid primase-like protien
LEKSADKCIKEISPIILEQMIAITRGLFASDAKFDNIEVAAVEDFITTGENYERTRPLTSTSELKDNRVYVDLDGKAPGLDECDFMKLIETITGVLMFFDDDISLMSSNQYNMPTNAEKTEFENKISFRITYKYKHGSKQAILKYVIDYVATKLRTDLDGVVQFVLEGVDEKDDTKPYLQLDTGVYNPKGRKMRMLGQSKVYYDVRDKETGVITKKGYAENRPNKLETCSDFIDTLITYIPPSSVALPEPVNDVIQPKVKATKDKKAKPSKKEKASKEESDDEEDDDSSVASSVEADENEDIELLTKVVMGISKKRADNFNDWMRIGWICFNEDLPLSVWDTFSKQSKKYVKGECKSKWAEMNKGLLTQASLWNWLKIDNPTLWSSLTNKRTDFWKLIKNANHAETARYFYNIKPDGYAYNESLGWFQLLPTNAWKHYDKVPSGLMTDIWATLKKVLQEHTATLDFASDDDTTKSRLKMCMKFGMFIGTKGFVDGVVSFLPSNYNDDQLMKKMDESRHLFAFNNAVVDLNAEKLSFRPIHPLDYVCLHTGYMAPSLESNKEVRNEIVKVLMSIWEDKSVVDYVMRVIASCLSGTKKWEEFYVWTGKGGNGKGLISAIIKRVFGDYFHTISHELITKRDDKKSAPNPQLAKAKGKRFVQAQEPEADDKLQVGIIKEMTGGDDEITARQLYRDPVIFVPQFGLFLQCNTIPKLNKIDGGIKRRMVIIPFPFQFVENVVEKHHRPIDTDLKDKITKSIAWRDEFMLMLMEAYKTIGSTLDKPQAVLWATSEYMVENDAVKTWLAQNYNTGLSTTDKNYWYGSDELRQTFLSDTRTKEDAMTPAKFKDLMIMNGVCLERLGNHSTYIGKVFRAGNYWKGIERMAEVEVDEG